MKIRRLSIENLEHRRVLAAGGIEGPDWESIIVMVNDNVANPRAVGQKAVNAHGGQLGQVYEHSIKGFSAQLPAAAIAALAKNPHVKLIESDLVMQAFGQVIPTGIDRIDAELSGVAKVNGLDGIDQRVDVNIAIIDSGIDSNHPDLNVAGGRHFYTVNSGPPRNRGSFQDADYEDDYGHGTHVAGTAAALDNDFGVVGVAPGANLYAVKVLGSSGSGYLSDIIAGIDWVTGTRKDGDATNDIDVANMSLGGLGASTAYHEAIKRSVNAGVVYVVAAGNSYRDILGTDFQFGTSDDTIPAAYPEVATISAIADTDGRPDSLGGYNNYSDPIVGRYLDDTFADFSNYSNSQSGGASYYTNNNKVTSLGLGIDLMMPGVDIYSTARNGGYATMSGTSMASPHAAGLAALYIAEHGRATDAAGVYAIRQALIDGGKSWTSPEGLYVPDPTYIPDSPDNHIENLGWAGPAAPVPTHDVAITSVTATPTTALVGEIVQIQVDVENQGTFAEVFDIDVTVGGQTIYQGFVSLNNGSMTTIDLEWVPTTADTFTIVASTQGVSEESDSADNSADTIVNAVTPIHDVAIASINVASSVVRGDTVTVSVDVANQGTFVETIHVTLAELPDATSIAPQSIANLAPGATATLVFSWTTSVGTSLGSHPLTASVATVSGETNTADNSASTSISVIDVPPPPIESTIDDGDAGYDKTASGWSVKSSASAYNGDYDSASSGNGSAVATWNFAGLPAGQYEVYATWVSHPKKQASNAPYSVLGTTVLVNQQNPPNNAQIAGWERLTIINFDGNGDLSVRLTNNANGIVVADAVRVVPVQTAAGIGQSLTVASPPSSTSSAMPPLATALSVIKKAKSPADLYFSTFDGAVEIALPDESVVPPSTQVSALISHFEQLHANLSKSR